MSMIFKPILEKAEALPETAQRKIADQMRKVVQEAWLEEQLRLGEVSLAEAGGLTPSEALSRLKSKGETNGSGV